MKEVTTLFTFIGFHCISCCLVLLENRSWSYLLTLPRSMPIAVVFEYFRICMAFTIVLLRLLPITPRPCPFSQRWWDKKCKLSKAISMLDSSKSCLTPWLALITLGKNTLGKKKNWSLTLWIAFSFSFIPICFSPNALNYETGWVFRHGVLVFVGCGVLYALQIFPSNYIHMLSRTAIKLGQWSKIEGRISHAFYNQWSSSTVWPQNSFCRHGKELYKSEGIHNCAEPGNATQSRFYVRSILSFCLISREFPVIFKFFF